MASQQKKILCPFVNTEDGCKYGDTCRKFHPTKPCRDGPNCKRQSLCTYAHKPGEVKFNKKSILCSYVNTEDGCKNGDECEFFHPRKECYDFLAGNCKKGAKCKFLHNYQQNPQVDNAEEKHQQPTKPCSFYQEGRCKKGNACTYLHIEPQEEVQRPRASTGRKLCVFYFTNGTCKKGAACKFGHSDRDLNSRVVELENNFQQMSMRTSMVEQGLDDVSFQVQASLTGVRQLLNLAENQIGQPQRRALQYNRQG